jgi:hypothetical protein
MRDVIFLAIGALFGLGTTVMAAAAPLYFPNSPPWLIHAAFWSGIALMALMVLDGGLMFFWGGPGPRLGPGAIINVALMAMTAALIWHYSPAQFAPQQALPGFTASALIRLYDTPEAKNRYIFDLATSDGAKAAFYLSASEQFTYSITDTNGVSYNLEIPIGNSGIPIDRYIFLYCEAGVSENSTVVRVMIDAKEIRRRVYDFPISLGKKDWTKFTVGADNQGQHNSPFKIAMFSAGHTTFLDAQVKDMFVIFTKYLKDTGSDIRTGTQ